MSTEGPFQTHPIHALVQIEKKCEINPYSRIEREFCTNTKKFLTERQRRDQKYNLLTMWNRPLILDIYIILIKSCITNVTDDF